MIKTMPRHVATTTGADAMVHAIEAYTSATRKNPLSDMLACEALRYLMNNIEESLKPEAAEEIRSKMLLGAMLAGQAFANATVAAVHAFAYGLAEGFHLPHGLSNSLVLVPVLKFNAEEVPELYGELARNVLPETIHMDDRTAADTFIAKVETLLSLLDLNKNLREYGITEADLAPLTRSVAGLERLLNNNPRPITYDDALGIFQSVY